MRRAALFLVGLLACLPALAGVVSTGREDARVQAGFDQPSAVAVDAAGRLFVMDGVHDRVVVLARDGTFLRDFGAGVLKEPLDLALGTEGVWIADTGHHRLVLFDTDGAFRRAIALPDAPCAAQQSTGGDLARPGLKSPRCADGSAPPAAEPVGLALFEGVAYWTDRAGHRLCWTRLEDGATQGCSGRRGEQDGEFQYPGPLVFDKDGYLNVVDLLGGRVQHFDRTGRHFVSIGRFGLSSGELYRPAGLAMDAASDTLFISDGYLGTVSVFRHSEFQGLLQDAEGRPLHFASPTGLSARDGALYVVETGANAVRRIAVTYLDAPPPPAPSAPVAASPAAPVPEPAVAFSGKSCLLCHLSWDTELPEALRTVDAQGALPEASERMCLSCHNGRVIDSRRAIGRGAQHPTVYESAAEKKRHADLPPRKDKLPDEFPHAKGERLLRCTACHTPHGDSGRGEAVHAGHNNPWMRVPNRGGDLCEKCHESRIKGARVGAFVPGSPGKPDADEKLKGSNHPIGLRLAKPPVPGARGFATEPKLHEGLPEALIAAGGALGHEDTLICQSCHQVHGGHGEGQLTALTLDGDALCAACHPRQFAKNKEDARKKGVHPVGVKLDEPVKIAGKEIKTVTCLACHATHDGKPGTAALVETDHNGELCSHCHKEKQTVVGSDHDLRVTAKDKKNAHGHLPAATSVCGACHSLHGADTKRPHLFDSARVSPTSPPSGETWDKSTLKRDALCLECHSKGGAGEKKIVHRFSHPHKKLVLRSNKKIMPLLNAKEESGEFGEIACATCHEPHVWDADSVPVPRPDGTLAVSTNQKNLEGSNRDAFLRAKDLDKTFCVACHGLETLVKYKYYHDAGRARTRHLDYLD